jgi:hypothetical protein
MGKARVDYHNFMQRYKGLTHSNSPSNGIGMEGEMEGKTTEGYKTEGGGKSYHSKFQTSSPFSPSSKRLVIYPQKFFFTI